MADRRGSVARDQRRGSVTGGGAGNGWRGSITEVTPHDLRMALEEHTAEESELQDLLATYERIAKAGHESKIRAKEGKDNFQPIFIIHLCQAGVPEALVLTANIHVRQRAVVMQFLATSWALIGPAETLEAFQRAGIDQRLETMIRHHRMDPSLVERICKLRTVFVEAKMPRYLRCFAKIVSGEALPAWVTQWYTWLRMDTVDFDFREEQRKLERRDKLQKMAREKREKEEYAAKLANRRESSTGARRASVSPAAGAGRRASAAGGHGDGPDYLAARRSSIADANAAAAKALEAAAGLDENGSSKSYYGGIGDGMDYGMDRISSMTASTADPNSARDTRRSRNGNAYGNDAPRTPSGAWTNESGNNDASSGGAGADDKRRSSVIVGKNGMLTQARRKSEVVALPGAGVVLDGEVWRKALSTTSDAKKYGAATPEELEARRIAKAKKKRASQIDAGFAAASPTAATREYEDDSTPYGVPITPVYGSGGATPAGAGNARRGSLAIPGVPQAQPTATRRISITAGGGNAGGGGRERRASLPGLGAI